MARKKNQAVGVESWYFWVLLAFAVILPLIYTPWTFEIFAISKVTFVRLVGSILLISFCLEAAVKRRVAFDYFHILAFAFLLITAASTAMSMHRPTSLLGLRSRYFGLITQISFFGIYLAAAGLSWRKRRIRYFLSANLVAAIIVSLIGIWQYFGASFPIDLHKYFADSAYSTFGNPNFLGEYLVIIVPLAIGFLLFSSQLLDIWLSATGAVLSVIAIILTNSSGAIVGLAIAALLFICLYLLPLKFNFSLYRSLLIFFIITIVLALLGSSFIISQESVSWRSRVRGWKAVSKIALDNSILGAGPDTVRFAYPRYIAPLKGNNDEVFEDGHNLFLTIGATTGLPALILYFSILILAFCRGLRSMELDKDKKNDSILILAGLASLAGYIAAEMVNPDFVVSAAFSWLLLGLIISLSTPEKRTVELKALVGYPLAAIVIAICSMVILLSSGSYLAEYYLLRAEMSPGVAAAAPYYAVAQEYNPFYDMYSIRQAERLLGLVGKSSGYVDSLALSAAQKSIIRSPLEADNYVVMANIYRRLAERGDRQKNLEIAADYCRASLKRNPYQKFALQHLAEILNQLGRKQEALSVANQYLRLYSDPGMANLRNSLQQIK